MSDATEIAAACRVILRKCQLDTSTRLQLEKILERELRRDADAKRAVKP